MPLSRVGFTDSAYPAVFCVDSEMYRRRRLIFICLGPVVRRNSEREFEYRTWLKMSGFYLGYPVTWQPGRSSRQKPATDRAQRIAILVHVSRALEMNVSVSLTESKESGGRAVEHWRTTYMRHEVDRRFRD